MKKRSVYMIWSLTFSLACLALAQAAHAVVPPETEPAAPLPGLSLNEPVTYIQLLPSKEAHALLADLKKEQTYILGYQDVALLNHTMEHPILVTQAYNLRLNKFVKLYVNWREVAAIQIIHPSISLRQD